MNKYCTHCKVSKSISDFYGDKRTKDGLQSWCKICIIEWGSNYRQDNKSIVLVKDRLRYEKHREQRAIKQQSKHRSDPRHRMLVNAKTRANKLQLPYTIVLNDIELPEFCSTGCNTKLIVGNGKQSNASPTLDRVVPSYGYVPGNVFVICYRCNAIKSDGSVNDHRRIIEYILSRGG